MSARLNAVADMPCAIQIAGSIRPAPRYAESLAACVGFGAGVVLMKVRLIGFWSWHGHSVGVERFAEFCDRLLVAAVQRALPPHEHEQLVAHYLGLLAPGPTTSARPQAKRD